MNKQPNILKSPNATGVDATVWIRPRLLAARWNCSISQAFRLVDKHRIRKCLLGGTGINGSSARNAMVLLSMEDVLNLEKKATV